MAESSVCENHKSIKELFFMLYFLALPIVIIARGLSVRLESLDVNKDTHTLIADIAKGSMDAFGE